MLKLIFLALVILNENSAKRVDGICSNKNTISNRIILRLGDSGVLTAYNVTVNNTGHSNSTHQSCHVEIVSCPSCVISLTFIYMNLSCYCGNNIRLFLHNPCRCDYVWITEPQYETSGISFCKIITASDFNNNLGYKSKTRGVKIFLFYSRPQAHSFTLEYKSELNRQFFFGSFEPHPEMNSTRGFITSPFFPAFYPKDLVSEYIISCVMRENHFLPVKPSTDSPCKVHLAFTDFQIGFSSVIEFYDGRHRIDSISGSSFRPPVIVTSTNSLTLRFYASGQSNLGFKAEYTFLRDNYVKKLVKPSVDCGGFVENIGGTITMMNMVNSELKLYDCIWLIKPLKNFFNIKSHLYLKITSFLDFAGQAELEIRQGLTSESPLLETLHYPVQQRFKEHIFPLEFGYYISVRALFGPTSHLAIAYSSFSYNQCFVFSDFICQNYRCISKKLRCDGFDHCGDNSDEPAICYKDWNLEPTIGRWHTQSPNYYFPKIKNYSDLHTASLVLLVSLVTLVFLFSALSLILYRMSGRNRQQTALQTQFQLSLSDIRDSFSDEVYVESIIIDDPPCYEPPPNYEDIIQLKEVENIQQKPAKLPRCKQSALSEENLKKLENSQKDQKQQNTEFYLRNLFSTSSSPTTPGSETSHTSETSSINTSL